MESTKISPHKRYIERFRIFYDKYCKVYNASTRKLTQFAELSHIYSGVNAVWIKQQESLEKKVSHTIQQFKLTCAVRNNEGKELTFERAWKIANELQFIELEAVFAKVKNDLNGLYNQNNLKQLIDRESNKIIALKGNENYFNLLDETFHELEKIQIITPNINALEKVMNEILTKEYPKSINYFRNISEIDQQRIIKVGRPLNEDLPQSDIETFISNNLFHNGKLTADKNLIHETGAHEGNPNWNQLAEKYFEENSEVFLNDIITKRQLIERIKKAYEVIIVSMK